MESNFMATYKNYWQRKNLLETEQPHFPTVRHFASMELSPAEKIIFKSIENCDSLLDFGAGDLRIKKKLVNQGFKGSYETLDLGDEFSYDYSSLAGVHKKFDAILFLDVIEHLPLEEGLALLNSLLSILNPGGCLVLQTPNARCIRSQKASDMSHLHIYNLPDLWAYLSVQNMKVHGWRMIWTHDKQSLRQKVQFYLSKFVTSYLLGSDYADNILLTARKDESGH